MHRRREADNRVYRRMLRRNQLESPEGQNLFRGVPDVFRLATTLPLAHDDRPRTLNVCDVLTAIK